MLDEILARTAKEVEEHEARRLAEEARSSQELAKLMAKEPSRKHTWLDMYGAELSACDKVLKVEWLERDTHMYSDPLSEEDRAKYKEWRQQTQEANAAAKAAAIAAAQPELERLRAKAAEEKAKVEAERAAMIAMRKENMSLRQLAKIFRVNKRTVQFVCDPEKLEACKDARARRGGSKRYYRKDYNTKAMKQHRDHKREVFNILGITPSTP